jgi:hypothetical protein
VKGISVENLNQLFRYAGWSAYISGITTIIGFVTLMIFFTVGQPFGTINDISAVFVALSMIPVSIALYKLQQLHTKTLSLIATCIGIISMLVASITSILLIFRIIDFEQSLLPTLTAFGTIGIWLIMSSYVSLKNGQLPKRLSYLGIVAGVGYILSNLGFWLGGQQHPLLAVGSLIAIFSYPIWAFWLGRLFSSSND